MKKVKIDTDSAKLRQKSEELLKRNSKENAEPISESEVLKLIHELQVHQIELELQNKELIEAKEAAQIATEKYVVLYDFALFGFFTLSKEGEILAVDFNGAKMLGKNRSELVNRRFPLFISDDSKPIFNSFCEKISSSKAKQSCEVELLNNSSSPTYLHLSGVIKENDDQFFVMALDITSRKIAEIEQIKLKEKAQESEEKYRALYENAPLPYQSLNEDGSFKDVSPAWLSTLGYKREEVIGKFYKDFLHPDWQSHFEKNFPAFKKRGYVSDVHFKIRHKKGHYIDISFEGCIGYHPDGSFKQTYCVFQDITYKKQVENELIDAKEKAEENELKFRNAFNSAGIGMCLVSLDGKFLKLNNSALDIWGYKESELLNMTFQQITHPDDLDKDLELLNETIEGKINNYSIVKRYYNKKGEIIFANLNVSIVRNLKNEPQFFVSQIEDITKEIKFEQELIKSKEKAEENEAKFRELFSSVNDAIFIFNPDTLEILEANEATSKIYGYSHDELIGMSSLKFSAELEKSKSVGKLIKTEKKINVKLRHHKKKDGTDVFVELSTFNIIVNGKNIFYAVCHDITDIKKTELELIKAKEEAEKSEINQRMHKQEIELNNERLESLLKISQLQTDSIQDLLDFALNEAINLTFSKIGYIYFYNENTKQFSLNTWSKDVMKECEVMNPQTIYDLDTTGCWGEAVRQRKPIVINNYQAENTLKKGTPHGHVKLLKFLTIPVIFDDKIVAVAGVANKAIDYDDSDIRQLTLLMDNVWKIAERINLIENLRIAKKETEESEQRLKLASSSAELGIWDWNLNDNSMIWNERMFELYGIKQDTFPNTIDAWTNGLHPEDKERAIGESNDALAGGKQFDTTFRVLHPNGTVKYLKADAVVIRDSNKKAIRMIGINKDVTESILAEQSLKTSETQLKELNATKDKLFSIIAHDLRSPFNSILGFSELLSENVKDFNIEESKRYSDIINSAAQNSLNLLDNLLNWAKSQTGNLGISSEKISLTKVILEVIQLKKLLAKSKNISLKYTPSDEFEVYSDVNMLRLVLRNLISNAIKFTKPRGNISISVISVQNYVEISVADNGVGMSDETCKNLFDISTNTTSSGTANEKGSGLGLVLCKEFVKKLGGNIWVESEEGIGSQFSFTIPSEKNNKELPKKSAED